MNREEDLQRRVESGEGFDGDLESEAYRMVFRALEREPDLQVSAAFADRLISVLGAEVSRKEARRDRWWLAIGILVVLAAFAYVVSQVSFSPSVGAFTFLATHWRLLTFAVLFTVVLQIIERRLLRRTRVE